jgi:hypothetical protein
VVVAVLQNSFYLELVEEEEQAPASALSFFYQV